VVAGVICHQTVLPSVRGAVLPGVRGAVLPSVEGGGLPIDGRACCANVT
jgi:hypothetical protein